MTYVEEDIRQLIQLPCAGATDGFIAQVIATGPTRLGEIIGPVFSIVIGTGDAPFVIRSGMNHESSRPANKVNRPPPAVEKLRGSEPRYGDVVKDDVELLV